jgi:hypothetical protein
VTHSSVLMRQQAEQRRWKREAEERERAAKLLPRPQQQPDQHGQRIAAIEQQLEAVRLGYRQALAQRSRQEMLDALHAYNHPPQPPEPTVIYIEAEAGNDGPAYLNPDYWR